MDVQTTRPCLSSAAARSSRRDLAVTKAFTFARTLRDACLTWPARVGPALAAQFDVDAAAVTVALDEQVRELLEELAGERAEF